MTTISVVAAIWGDRYRRFVPAWWDSVAALQRQPDEVVIITDRENFDYVHSSKPFGYKVPTAITGYVQPLEFNKYWDTAFRNATKDWIATCCIDDVFLPEALNDIDKADEQGCELIADSCKLSHTNTIWRGYWNPEEIFDRITMPGAAPMKRELYERVGGFDREIYWSDWAFYMKCAKAGVKVFHSDIVRIVFDEGANHQTQSGIRLDSATRSWADAQIREYSARLKADK